MELCSKSQRGAVGPDVADRDLSGEAVIRLAHDPSPPVLSPVRLQTAPVPSDSNPDDAEQHQEHAHTTPESGTLTHVYKRLFYNPQSFDTPPQGTLANILNAPNSISAGALPQTPPGEVTALPQTS